jgi:ADP-ribose pyrophosphatase YjhB (NUDIX family)
LETKTAGTGTTTQAHYTTAILTRCTFSGQNILVVECEYPDGKKEWRFPGDWLKSAGVDPKETMRIQLKEELEIDLYPPDRNMDLTNDLEERVAFLDSLGRTHYCFVVRIARHVSEKFRKEKITSAEGVIRTAQWLHVDKLRDLICTEQRMIYDAAWTQIYMINIGELPEPGIVRWY